MTMPKSLEEILAIADELADWCEQVGPDPANRQDLGALLAVARAADAVAATEAALVETVYVARKEGFSWADIGRRLGTSGEAARQRYGRVLADREAQRRGKPPKARRKAG
jgi:hypothetical protein